MSEPFGIHDHGFGAGQTENPAAEFEDWMKNLPDHAFVRVAYQRVFGRDPDPDQDQDKDAPPARRTPQTGET